MPNKGYVLIDSATDKVQDSLMAQTPMGDIYFTSNAVATVITTQSTFTLVDITTTTNMLTQFDSPQAGRLRYTGTVTKNFHCGCTLDVKSAGNLDIVKGVLYKNGGVNVNKEFTSGTQLTAGTISHKTGTAGDQISTAIHVMVSLAQNDYLELGISNETDTDDLTVLNMNLFTVGGYN